MKRDLFRRFKRGRNSAEPNESEWFFLAPFSDKALLASSILIFLFLGSSFFPLFLLRVIRPLCHLKPLCGHGDDANACFVVSYLCRIPGMLLDRRPARERSASVNASALVRPLGGLRKPTKTTSPGQPMLPGFRHGGNAIPVTGAAKASHEAMVRYKTPHRRKCLIINLLRSS